ncbi:MAG: carboxypeptidase-like regulatory domain-containing protein [Bacteroidota bacterium]
MSSVKTLFKRGLLAVCSSVCLLSTTLGNDQPLIAALASLENQYNVYFSYNPEELTDVRVNFATNGAENIEQAINRLLAPTVFQYETFGEKFYVIYNKSKAGKKDLRKLRRHWNSISKLEKKGNLSLNRSQPNIASSINDEVNRLKGAKWNEGKVVDATTKEGLIGANVIIEHTNAGTATDAYGNFSFHAPTRPPYQLRISYTGYRDKIIHVTTANQYKLNVQLSAEGVLLNQIVVGASRHSERFVEAPVTVEKLDINALPTSSAEGVIESLANLKGVQVVKGSIAGAVINTRGFANMNNLRFLMHLDGMDVTSPAFGVYSNMGGVSALDVQSVEIIPGASSALYGANAFNGILLMQSKDPFVHQGLSAQLKTGITQHSISDNSAYNNFSIRYAKSFNNKLAYKIDYEGLFTKDWIAQDLSERNLNINPEIPADRQPPLVSAHQAGYDAVNIHGDKDTEAFTKVLETGEMAQTSSGQPLLWELDNVHRTGYTEQELFDSRVSNHRLNVGLHYRLNKDWRVEYLYKYAVQDLILRHTTNYPFYDFTLQHHKIELNG